LKQQLSSPPRKQSLDEDSFQQLLSAAHVIQEHNDRLLSTETTTDSDATLAEIVETQKLVRTGELDLKGAAGLIAARLQRITKASGAAIGILEDDQLTYLAGVGSAATEIGAQVTIDASLSAACLHTGKISRSRDIAGVRPAESGAESAVGSLIAVPIHRESQVAGVVELRFAAINAFSEDQVYACELMAALMTEALARADELDAKEALAAERAAMLQILEKIKPQLERLVGEPIPDLSQTIFPAEAPAPAKKQTSTTIAASFEPLSPAPAAAATTSRPPTTAGLICRGCGREFLGDEAFCGKCGMTRSKPGGDNGHLQSKWASMWYMQQAAGQAEVKRESEARGNGKKSREAAGESKPLKLSPQAPVSFQPVSRKREDAIPQAPVSRQDAPRDEKFAPRLPVSLEEIVAQFADETDLIPVTAPSAAAHSIGHGEATAPDAIKPFEDVLNWKLGRATEIEQDAFAEPETEAHFHAAGTPKIYEDDPLTIRNPLGGDEDETEAEIAPPASTALAETSPWTSAANAREWLEGMQGGSATRRWLREQWRHHYANIYLGAAGMIFVAALFSLFTAPAPVARKNPAEAQLTTFERLMVGLGLAEAPPAPVYLGKPDRQVWVDLHTALYYCPGSEFYGKTAGGKYETQRSAQLDQFESASRRACD